MVDANRAALHLTDLFGSNIYRQVQNNKTRAARPREIEELVQQWVAPGSFASNRP